MRHVEAEHGVEDGDEHLVGPLGAPDPPAGQPGPVREVAQGAHVDGRLVAQLARELVEVDVVEPGAAVGLGDLIREGVERCEVLQDAGPVTEAEPLLAAELLGPAPVLPRPQRLQVAVEAPQRLHQLR